MEIDATGVGEAERTGGVVARVGGRWGHDSGAKRVRLARATAAGQCGMGCPGGIQIAVRISLGRLTCSNWRHCSNTVGARCCERREEGREECRVLMIRGACLNLKVRKVGKEIEERWGSDVPDGFLYLSGRVGKKDLKKVEGRCDARLLEMIFWYQESHCDEL